MAVTNSNPKGDQTLRIIRTTVVASLLISGFLTACAPEKRESAKRDAIPSLPMKPGLWETQVTFTDIQVQGLSEKQEKKLLSDISNQLSGQSCLSAQQARKPEANFFTGGHSDDCKYKKFAIAEGRLDMSVDCSMKAMATIDMDMQGPVSATALDLDISPELRLPMVGKVTLHGKAEGRYLGACEKEK